MRQGGGMPKLAPALVALLAGLHWNEYRIAEGSGILASQGRYLFPLLPLAGTARQRVADVLTALNLS